MGRSLLAAGLAGVFLSVLGCAALPGVAPRGQPVARSQLIVSDQSRPEIMTADPSDHREIPVWIWYPCVEGSGRASPYFPDLRSLSRALADSGEVSGVEVAGMHILRSTARLDGILDSTGAPFPVVVLLPGNGTNVEFYHALSAHLAARGYVVVGIDHPYDVAAVKLSDGRIAGFASSTFFMDPASREVFVTQRVRERVLDVHTVLDALRRDAGPLPGGALDPGRVAVVGHSLGGIAAAQIAKEDASVLCWVNLDGLQAGGPFSTDPAEVPSSKPFLFITKETELHPHHGDKMRSITGGAWRVVLEGATHDSFTDGPLLLPFSAKAHRLFTAFTRYLDDFLDHFLRGFPAEALTRPASAGVMVEAYGPQR